MLIIVIIRFPAFHTFSCTSFLIIWISRVNRYLPLTGKQTADKSLHSSGESSSRLNAVGRWAPPTADVMVKQAISSGDEASSKRTSWKSLRSTDSSSSSSSISSSFKDSSRRGISSSNKELESWGRDRGELEAMDRGMFAWSIMTSCPLTSWQWCADRHVSSNRIIQELVLTLFLLLSSPSSCQALVCCLLFWILEIHTKYVNCNNSLKGKYRQKCLYTMTQCWTASPTRVLSETH